MRSEAVFVVKNGFELRLASNETTSLTFLQSHFRKGHAQCGGAIIAYMSYYMSIHKPFGKVTEMDPASSLCEPNEVRANDTNLACSSGVIIYMIQQMEYSTNLI